MRTGTQIDDVEKSIRLKQRLKLKELQLLLAQKSFLPSLVTLSRQGWCCHLKPVTVTQICKTGC